VSLLEKPAQIEPVFHVIGVFAAELLHQVGIKRAAQSQWDGVNGFALYCVSRLIFSPRSSASAIL